jgi:hypothetical protein
MASSLTFPLYSQSLSDLLTKAQEESNTATALTINKEQSLLTISMNNLSRNNSYSINPTMTAYLPEYSTDSSATETESTYSIGGAGNLLVFTFPGSKHIANSKPIYDDTNLYLDLGTNIYYDSDGGSLYYSISPKLGADHTFLYGEYDTIQEDATEQINYLTVDQSYQSGLIDYKKSVLNMVKSIITNEQSQKKLEKSIEDTETTIKNNLELELYNTSTVAYKSDMITLNSLKNTLENTINQREQLESRFKDYAGFDYEGVDSIDVPNLNVNPSQEDSITVQIAKLKLQLAQNTVDEVIKDKDRSSLLISGSDTPTYYNYSIPVSTKTSDRRLGNKANVSLTYTADDFSVGGDISLATTYDDGDWTNQPTITFGGTWTNDSTKEYDIIESKKNANELIAAQSSLSSALSEYSYQKINLKSDIDTWNFTYSQLKDNMEIAEENNKLTQQMFDLGLKSQSELDKSNLDYEQMKYDELTTLIDGWLVELDIESLNL